MSRCDYVNFNAQHSPMGAFMSFTCGQFATGGGIGLEIGRPADQNLFVGVKEGTRLSDSPIRCLPFIRSQRVSGAADYQVEQANVPASQAAVSPYHAEQITRRYGWASDEWTTPDFEFTVYTPFGPIPDPSIAANDAIRRAILPAIVATLRVDNRHGQTAKTAVFAIDFNQPGTRVLKDGDAVGFAWRRHMGVLATLEHPAEKAQPFPFQRWSLAEGVCASDPVHALGNCGGVAVEVPPGERRTLVLAIGTYLDGIVTTGVEAQYLYCRHYGSLNDVLTTALSRSGDLQTQSARLDQQLCSSGLSVDQQYLVAHATRSYYGSTQLLEVAGEPFWVVNEGEYCMMNTLDLSVDQVFWELGQNTWVVRNLLDQFLARYSYLDELQAGSGRVLPGGLSFTHDMGVNNNFSAPGCSSYELPHLTGCFSYMTAEQLCNWILIATCYVQRTCDMEWLKRNAGTLRSCATSLSARGGETGLVQFDSARCRGGQEITTYDSLDPSLAQTRSNAYMAVKCWATYVGLTLLFDRLDDPTTAAHLQGLSERAAEAIVAHASEDGVLPAIFEPHSVGYDSRILPAAEGLMYPAYWKSGTSRKLAEILSSAPAEKLVTALRRHTRAVLLDPQRRNLFKDGGIRLSSTSNNSWMSKIAIFQHVVRHWFSVEDDKEITAIFAEADAAHVRWQIQGSGYWACSDQFVNGEAKGSRYYPRIITTALWLSNRDESGSSAFESDENRRTKR